MKLTIEIDIPDDVASNPGHLLGIRDYVLLEAKRAANDYIDNEINPDGCWCIEIMHRETCRHHIVSY